MDFPDHDDVDAVVFFMLELAVMNGFFVYSSLTVLQRLDGWVE